MSSQVMTLLGAIGAAISFLLAGLPDNTPWWGKLGIGALNAFLTFYLGQSNRGTAPRFPKPPKAPTVIVPLLALSLLGGGVAWGQQATPIQAHARNNLTIGTANERLEFPAGMRAIEVVNSGPNSAYVDLDGTGIASPSKSTSHIVRAGMSRVFTTAVAGREIRVVGVIVPDGTAVLDLSVTE